MQIGVKKSVLVLGAKSESVQKVAGRGGGGRSNLVTIASETEGAIRGGVGGVMQVYGMGLGGAGDGIW